MGHLCCEAFRDFAPGSAPKFDTFFSNNFECIYTAFVSYLLLSSQGASIDMKSVTGGNLILKKVQQGDIFKKSFKKVKQRTKYRMINTAECEV